MLDEEGQAELREALLEGPPPGWGRWSGPKEVARWIEQRGLGGRRGCIMPRAGLGVPEEGGHEPPAPQAVEPRQKGADGPEREAFKKVSPSG